MKNDLDELYNNLIQLSQEVKIKFRNKGLSVPVQNTDGSVRLGSYKIVKNPGEFYCIVDNTGETVINHINLPHTALLLANGLSLGYFTDTKLITQDQQYGYALFEELLQKNAIENSRTKTLEHYELAMTKFKIAKSKREYYKNTIMKSFQKLIKLV
jgi:hypothetical protein